MRVACVGAVMIEHGRLLLVRRGRPPSAGLWSIPGGRVEPGESAHDAVVREVREETSLDVEVGRLLGSVEIDAGDEAGTVYDVDDYVCTVVGSTDARGGGDATDARWVDRAEFDELPKVPGLADALSGWGVLPT